MELGARKLSIEDVVRVARSAETVSIDEGARARMAMGRTRLEELLARGERIYGVNTGIGGNAGISPAPDQMELLQHNLMRELGCATGQPLPSDAVRAAMLLRIATFLSGASAVRPELVDALVDLLNRGVTPVVPRYGSVGASGDLMPSAYPRARQGPAGEFDNRPQIAFLPHKGLPCHASRSIDALSSVSDPNSALVPDRCRRAG